MGNKTGKARCSLEVYILSNREPLKVFKEETDLNLVCFRKFIW